MSACHFLNYHLLEEEERGITDHLSPCKSLPLPYNFFHPKQLRKFKGLITQKLMIWHGLHLISKNAMTQSSVMHTHSIWSLDEIFVNSSGNAYVTLFRSLHQDPEHLQWEISNAWLNASISTHKEESLKKETVAFLCPIPIPHFIFFLCAKFIIFTDSSQVSNDLT